MYVLDMKQNLKEKEKTETHTHKTAMMTYQRLTKNQKMTSKDENRNHSKRRTNKQKKPNFKWEAGLPTSSTAQHRITCLYVK